ncbi:MAG: FKBP-type peptidyl-prolyl cis-trans isomerase [Gemmatimonadales bacterium]
MSSPNLWRAAALVTLVAGAACGGTDPVEPPKIEETQFASSLGIDLSLMTKTASGLYYRDLTTGSGATATVGKRVAIHYNGFLPDGTQFDSNTGNQTPFQFTLGSGQVIGGFDEGVRGMAPGGIRQLIIPPNLGYGAAGSGPIPPNSILVFRIELVSIL